MTGWLSRGLITTAVGAILAFAVTVRVAHVDIANAGAIIMFAGIGYLLVHLCLLGYERGWLSSDDTAARRGTEPYEGRDRRYDPDDPYRRQDRLDRAVRDDRFDRYDRSHDRAVDRTYDGGYGGSSDERPRPAHVEYHRAPERRWTGSDPDDTRVMPPVTDDTIQQRRDWRRDG